MSNQSFVDLLTYAEPALCVVLLMLVIWRKQLGRYAFVSAFLGVRILSSAILIPLMHLCGHGIYAGQAYRVYFYVYWGAYAVEAMLGFGIIYSIYNLAMSPLPGLQRLGRLMFRWAAGISVAIALTMAMGPQMTSTNFIVRAVTQLQQTQSVLTLCMLLFVCLAIRPMGLSYRSKIFGVSLGLGVFATAELASSAWMALGFKLYSLNNIIDGLAICVALFVWGGYFAVPEPKRSMIVLPTTSPFLRWNQISIALGDQPGYVALGEFTPEMFAPAELEIMRRASAKMVNAPSY